MKKPLTDEQFRSSLLVRRFNRGTELAPPGDPVTVMVMPGIAIDQIKPYDGNIRLTRNPKHDEIYHRIVTLGQEGELPITRRPGEAHFMIAKGGNTRLEIMQELWKAGDGRFQAINCRFYPWTRESDVLAAHIAENEVRGDNTFIEKALALQTLRQRLEEESGEALGLREFVRRLGDPEFGIGLRVSITQMHRLQYAARILYPLIPEALRTGLGPRQVEAIQKTEALYRTYWEKRGLPESGSEAHAAGFDVLFGEVLSQLDSPDFVIDALRPALEDHLAAVLDRPVRSIQAGIAALGAGIDLGAESSPEPDIDDEIPVTGGRQRFGSSPPSSREPVHTAPTPPSGTSGTSGTSGAQGGSMTTAHASVTSPPPEKGPVQDHYTGPLDVRSLRNRSYVLALRLAQRHGLAECVVNQPRSGLGYLMDLPQVALTGDQAHWVWWWLLSISEQMISSDRVPPENRFGVLALGNRWDEIYALVGGRPKWVIMPSVFLCSPHTRDSDFDDVMLLIQNTRRLRSQQDDSSLWD